MKKSFEIKVQSGIIKKQVQKEVKTSGVKAAAILPKFKGNILKTIMNDSMMTKSAGKISRITSRKPPEKIVKGGVRNA